MTCDLFVLFWSWHDEEQQWSAVFSSDSSLNNMVTHRAHLCWWWCVSNTGLGANVEPFLCGHFNSLAHLLKCFCLFFSVVVGIIYSTWKLRFSWVSFFFFSPEVYIFASKPDSINEWSVICLASKSHSNAPQSVSAIPNWNPQSSRRRQQSWKTIRGWYMWQIQTAGGAQLLWPAEGEKDTETKMQRTHTTYWLSIYPYLYNNWMYFYIDCSDGRSWHWPALHPQHARVRAHTNTIFPRRSAASSVSVSDNLFSAYSVSCGCFSKLYTCHALTMIIII